MHRLNRVAVTVGVATCVLAGASASSAIAAGPVSCGHSLDTSTIGSSFPFRMTIALPKQWCALYGDVPGTVDLVHVGSPASDDTQWWGPELVLAAGARVVKPADANRPASVPTTATSVPWPKNFFRYLASLHGVKVIAGPSPVTIGGVKGTQVTVKTPAMHPLIWTKGDTAWLGGGQSGLDPAAVRQFILLPVNGRKLLLTFPESPQNFSSRQRKVNDLWKSITFNR